MEDRVIQKSKPKKKSAARPEKKRPLDPQTGAVILFGSLAVSAAVTWALSLAFPLGQEWLGRFDPPLTSDGAWMMLGSWTVFPLALGAAFLRMARGVDVMLQVYAFAGVTYFLQSWAEFKAREDISLWAELCFTAVATLVFHALAKRHAPPAKPDEDESEAAP
jgi:hypothetical protein